MSKISFRGSSSQGHVSILRSKVKLKGQHVLPFSKEGNDRFGFLVKLPFQQYNLFERYMGSKLGGHAPFGVK